MKPYIWKSTLMLAILLFARCIEGQKKSFIYQGVIVKVACSVEYRDYPELVLIVGNSRSDIKRFRLLPKGGCSKIDQSSLLGKQVKVSYRARKEVRSVSAEKFEIEDGRVIGYLYTILERTQKYKNNGITPFVSKHVMKPL